MAKKAEKPLLPGIDVIDPETGFKATIPHGWNDQKTQGIFLLQNPGVPGLIMITNQVAWTEEHMVAEMSKEMQDPTMMLSPTRQLSEITPGIFSTEYEGTANGAPAVATGFCRHFEGAGAVIVAAVALREQFGIQLENAAASIVRSLAFTQQATSSDDLTAFFVGTWVTISTNTQSRFVLNPDGSYAKDSESSYLGRFRNETYGVQIGYWGVAGENRDAGRWIAQGTKQSGVFYITMADGSQATYKYSVHVEKGKTYWNEYYIGGKLYSKQR